MRRSHTRRSPRFSRRSWRAVFVAALAVVVAAVHQWRPEWFAPRVTTAVPTASPSGTGRYCRVARVVDGDTLVLTEGKERVRLIGADTPETVKPKTPVQPWGPEAAAFTKKFLAAGEVQLEFDVERRDKYGRTLAYVWVRDRMLNEELIRAGLARAELQYRYSEAMKARFRRAEWEARAAKRGLWSKSEPGCGGQEK